MNNLAESVAARAVDRALAWAEVLSRAAWDRYVSIDDRQEFLRRLLRVVTMVPILSEVRECRDPKDDRFLALALDERADCIVTGDKDLLAMNPWRGIYIVTPSGFLASTEGAGK